MFGSQIRIFAYFAIFSVFLSYSMPVSVVFAQGGEPIVVENTVSDSTIPSLGELNTVDKEEEIVADEGNTIAAPSVIAEEIDEDSFFDADDIVPQGEMGKSGPFPVNPTTQPASKFVTVTKNNEASSEDAKFIAAERAMALGRYDSALSILDNLYDENPKDGRVVMGRATTLQKLGRFDEAMLMYEKLEALEPENIDVKVNMLGLLSTRYPSIALRRLMALHDQHRDHVGVISQLAIAYAKSGDSSAAIRYLGTAASMEPRNAGHLFNMAVIADRSGLLDDAVKYYEKALEVDTIHGGGRSIPRESVYNRLSQIRS